MKTLQFNSITNFKLKTMKTMKTMKRCSMYALLAIAMIGCSDDDAAPEPINEEEVITTVILTLTPDSGEEVVLTAIDLDGDGPGELVTTMSGSFSESTEYEGAVQFLNETDPTSIEDITEEVLEEAEEHQVFYTTAGGLNIQTSYLDFDDNDNPLGLQITLTTGAASDGLLTVTLIHEPTKSAEGVSDGDITNAGGEIDIIADFDVSF
jgi:hypothetical protein